VPRTTTTTAPPPPPPTTTTTSPPGPAPLAIRNFAFLPSTLVIAAGTTVVVTNFDSIGHTWSSTTGAFDSGALGNGQSYSHTFATPGTYTYRCNIHPSMIGTIVVQ
jgi:plastocyanin